jgi:hypothetical protein
MQCLPLQPHVCSSRIALGVILIPYIALSFTCRSCRSRASHPSPSHRPVDIDAPIALSITCATQSPSLRPDIGHASILHPHTFICLQSDGSLQCKCGIWRDAFCAKLGSHSPCIVLTSTRYRPPVDHLPFVSITCTTHRPTVDHLPFVSITCTTHRPTVDHPPFVLLSCVTPRPTVDHPPFVLLSCVTPRPPVDRAPSVSITCMTQRPHADPHASTSSQVLSLRTPLVVALVNLI